MPNEEHDRMTVEMYNRTAKNPFERTKFIQELVHGLGQILMLPTPIIEQMIASLKQDIKVMEKNEKEHTSVIFAVLAKYGAVQARQEVAILQAFLDIRKTFLESMKKHGGKKLEEIPD